MNAKPPVPAPVRASAAVAALPSSVRWVNHRTRAELIGWAAVDAEGRPDASHAPYLGIFEGLSQWEEAAFADESYSNADIALLVSQMDVLRACLLLSAGDMDSSAMETSYELAMRNFRLRPVFEYEDTSLHSAEASDDSESPA